MTQPATFLVTPTVLDLFVRALVNEVDYDIHKGYECGEEDGLDHYPELVAEAQKMLATITARQGHILAGVITSVLEQLDLGDQVDRARELIAVELERLDA